MVAFFGPATSAQTKFEIAVQLYGWPAAVAPGRPRNALYGALRIGLCRMAPEHQPATTARLASSPTTDAGRAANSGVGSVRDCNLL